MLSPVEHASQVLTMIEAFRIALGARLKDISAFPSPTVPQPQLLS